MRYMPVFLLLVSMSFAFAQPAYQPPTLAVISEKIKGLPPHPRILLLKDREQEIRQRFQQQNVLSNLHKAILTESEKIIGLPPVERIQIGRRLLDKSRECLRRVFQLSYAYRVTGDRRFLARAEKELLAVSGFSDWNPTHFLDVAEMTMAVAIGYDWLYPHLSDGSRQKIRTAILEKGINPSYDKQYNSFLRSTNNWNQVCNAGMTFGALAIAEDQPELAAKTIQRALETIPVSMAVYAPHGAYAEGYGYWDYGTSFNVLMISALEAAFGTDFNLSGLTGFMKTGSFLQNMIGPIGLVHNWGDGGVKAHFNPAMFWFARKTGEESLLWNQLPDLSGDQTPNVKNRLIPTAMIWGTDLPDHEIPKPKELLWFGQGLSPVALMRTSWDDPNAIFVGFKAGAAQVNHGHMDAGSFVLDAFGERWAMDFGMQNYHSLESKGVQLWGRAQDAQRWQIFRYNNFVHNTLTVNNELHRVEGNPQIDAQSGDPKFLSVVSDLSDVFKGQLNKAKRGIAIHDGKSVVVRDEVKAGDQPALIRWTLLTPATVKIIDGKTVELSQNSKKMYLKFDSDAEIRVKTWSTDPVHDYDAPNPGTIRVGFEANVPAGREQVFNAVFSATPGPESATSPLASWPTGGVRKN